MIRLGSLAGYCFEGPRLLGGWLPPSTPAVYAILYRPKAETKPDRYAVTYVGNTDNLADGRLPFRHPRAPCWINRAGSRWKVYIATLEMSGDGHREQITNELIAIYRPRCNLERYDNAWKDEWIGQYTARDTGPLADRGPNDR